MEARSESLARAEEFLRRNQLALVTMVFTDIVGSTGLKQELGDRAAIELIQQHHAIVREHLRQFAGAEEIDTAGDSFFIVFLKPSDATRFALRLQRSLRELSQKIGRAVRDRVGIHVGEIFVREDKEAGRELFGIQIDTAARVMSLGTGDQILLSRFAFDNARQVLRGAQHDDQPELSWLNHGYYSLKGVEEPIEVCEVGDLGLAVLQAPGDSSKAHRFHHADDEPVLGWRPASGQIVPNTQWRLAAPLGEGGFGEVWLARHEQLKQERVFKFCFNAERARSLKREVTLFRLLRERMGNHPNIVGIHDVFFDQPPYYIVMDYVAGPSLSEWDGVADAPLETRLEIVAQIADALQAAHDAGVIHRDVKPGNILIAQAEDRPHALLTDFGIGQVVSTDALPGLTMLGFTQTMITPGSSAGTHLYMAPELVAGGSATIRSDIYALGVIVYQLALGDIHRPLASDWCEGIEDPLLCADIRNCVAGDPAKRFAGAAQLASHLRELPQRRAALAVEKAKLERIARKAYRRGLVRAASVALVIVAVVAALGVISFIQYRRAETSAERATHARNEAEKLIEFMGVDLRDKLKPIGRLELLDSANQRVRAYYRSFTDVEKDPGILSRQTTAFLNEGMILRDRGDQAGALKSFQEAHALRERLAQGQPENADFQADVATSSDWIGHTLRRQGNLASALEAYRHSLGIREKLTSRSPAEQRWQHDLATSWMNIGDALVSSGDLNGALTAYQKSRAIDEGQLQRVPSDREWQHDLITAYISIGDVLRSQNDLTGALTEFQAGLRLQQTLLESDPRNALWQRDLAVCFENVGDIVDAQGDHLGALKRYEEALTLHRRLAAQDPSNAAWQGELFVSYTKVGDSLAAQGELIKAQQRFRDGLEIAEALAQQDPTNASFQRTLAVAHERVGQILRKTNELDRSMEHLQQSLALRRQLLESDATNADAQRDLFVGLVQMGDLSMLQSRAKVAAETFTAALSIMNQLTALDPTNVDWQRDLIEAHDKLGQALEAEGTDAVPHFRVARTASEKLAAENANDLSARISLAQASFHLGRALRLSGDAASAHESKQTIERARALMIELEPKQHLLTADEAQAMASLKSAVATLR